MDRCERQLTLLGIIHTDPDGMKRLYRAVTSLQPATTTFELQDGRVPGLSPDKLKHLTDWASVLLSLEEEQSEELGELLKNYGYEWKIAQELKTLKQRVHFIDPVIDNIDKEPAPDKRYLILSSESKEIAKKEMEYYQLIEAIHPLFSFLLNHHEQEIVAVCSAYVFFSMEEREKIINHQYDKGPDRYYIKPPPSLLQRDQKMEEHIREIWKTTEGNLLHVSGLSHIYGQYQEQQHNLYGRLQDLKPVRRKLNEF